MTIFDCQKRHHEEHWVYSNFQWVPCTGTPRWPYTRPKPPRVDSDEYIPYRQEHHTIAVFNGGANWWVDCNHEVYTDLANPWTHHEAINYAHKLATERKQQWPG